MNWEAIGAGGEPFSALAVVLILGYLAAQVRQNSEGMKFVAKIDIEKSFGEYTELLVKDSVLLELQLKGMKGEELGEIEDARFSLLMQKATRSFSSMYYLYQTQGLSEDQWYESHRLIRWFTLAPAYRSLWKHNEKNYRAEFRNYLNKYFDSEGH